MQPFAFLKEIDSEAILRAITDEHPQTIALVAACLPYPKAADILMGLPPERQLAVIRRVANSQPVEKTVIETVERGLEAQLSKQDTVRIGGVESIAGMLDAVEPGTLHCILENLHLDDPELVGDIKQEMHTILTLRKMERAGKIIREDS